MSSRDKDFWQQYETFFHEKLPPCVVAILRECGYTLMSTLNDFKPETLLELEEHIDGHLRHVIENLQCCNAETYKNQPQFKFLPAHRNLIFGLQSKIQTMKERRRKKPNQRTVHSVLIDADDDDIGIVQQNEIVERNQNELLKKLHDFGRLKNYSAVIQMSMANITETVFSFGDGQPVGHCQIKCPYCANKYLTRYDKIWMTSNVNKHFREHETQTIADNQENEQVENSNSAENREVVDEFDAVDDTDDRELSRTIQLQIDALESPEKTQPSKYPRLVLKRVRLPDKNHRELKALGINSKITTRKRGRRPKSGN